MFFVLLSLKEQGPTPNGHLYAVAMDRARFNMWQKAIERLKRSKLITDKNHLLSLTDAGQQLITTIQNENPPKKAE